MSASNNTVNCDISALWEEYKMQLYNFILKRVKDSDTANDISQEVLIKVYNYCKSDVKINKIRSWLFQVAHNTIIDYYRKAARIQTYDLLPEVAILEENDAFEDAIKYLKPLLSFIPSKYADPLILSDIEELSQQEVAKKMNLSLSATKSRIQRARQLLRAEFLTCCNLEIGSSGSIISFEIKETCTPLQHLKIK